MALSASELRIGNYITADSIIITLNAQMLKGSCWPTLFLQGIKGSEVDHGRSYWLRCKGQPKKGNIRYVYLCINNKIPYRCSYVRSYDGMWMPFNSLGSRARAKGWGWIMVVGPVVNAPFDIDMNNFRGFRYTKELW